MLIRPEVTDPHLHPDCHHRLEKAPSRLPLLLSSGKVSRNSRSDVSLRDDLAEVPTAAVAIVHGLVRNSRRFFVNKYGLAVDESHMRTPTCRSPVRT